jgi:phosphatidylglycerol lysyltransferase
MLEALGHYGYLVLFLGSTVEGDAVLLAASFLAHRGYFHLLPVILTAAAGNTLADQVYYHLARTRGQEAFARKAAEDPRYEKLLGWVQRHGAALLFASRFMWGLRIAIPAACGASGMKPGTFLAVNALGGLFWAAVFGVGGYTLGESLERVVTNLHHYEWPIALAIFGVGIAALLLHRTDLRGAAALLLWRPARMAAAFAPLVLDATRTAGRLTLALPHIRLAIFIVLQGALNVFTALFAWRIHRWPFDELPLDVVHGSRALMMFAGLVLLALGNALVRRKHSAWLLALVLTATSAVLHVIHHVGVIRATLAIALTIELIRQRRRFVAKSDPVRLRRAAVMACVLALAIAVFGAVRWHELNGRLKPMTEQAAAIADTWRAATFHAPSGLPTPRAADGFALSVQLLTVLSATYVLALVLAPVAARRGIQPALPIVQRLAWEHGEDSLSYFAKQADKLHFIYGAGADRAATPPATTNSAAAPSATVSGAAANQAVVALGYRVVSRVAIVAGDPFGPADAIPAAIKAFVALCATNDWIPVFYEVSSRWLDAYREAGLRWFKVGEEAIIPVPTFTLQSSKTAKVRQGVNKILREHPDMIVSEYRRDPPDQEIDEQLEDISNEWLRGKRGSEMGFNLGIFSVEELADKRTIVAMDARGTVWAFLTWLPYRRGRALVLDAMRRRGDAPPSVMELLIAKSVELFKPEGLETLSLATAPLANVDETGAQSPYDRGVKLIFDHFSAIYGYGSLFFFKKKFDPAWEARYLVFPRPDQLPRVTYALVAVHTGEGLVASARRWLFAPKE